MALEVTFHPDYSRARRPVRHEPVAAGIARPDHETRLGQRRAHQPADRRASSASRRATWSSSRSNGQSIEIPVYVLPGQADYSVALPFGQFGEMRIKHVPDGGGTERVPAPQDERRCTPSPAARSRRPAASADLVMTQEHGVIPEGRDIVVEMSLEQHRTKVKDRSSTRRDATSSIAARQRDHGPKIGIPPDGHITEDDLKKGFQGGYGNTQQPPAPAARSRSGSRSTSPAPNCSTASSSGAW